ncbi:MAG: rhamnulokinase family protein [Bacteroidota bacterium]
MNAHHYLACDLGAESGRVMLGSFDGARLSVREVHRFPNTPLRTDGSLRWDITRLFAEIEKGLAAAAREGIPISSVSCDSWGVDYVLLGGKSSNAGMPYHYRDQRTNKAFERAFAIAPAQRIFEETGIQFMPINTLYQLHDDLINRPAALREAETLLTIADYFNYRLSGVAKVEASLASTTQLYNPRTRSWSSDLITQFGFPTHIFPEIVPSGTVLGDVLPELVRETGLQGCRVVAGVSHDTAAAVAAVPSEDGQWAYLSSGTWSLLGVEIASPVITPRSLDYNFTNEIGFGGSIRLLKNIPGMWIIQGCRRSWAAHGKEYSYETLATMAEESGTRSIIDPMDERFVSPDDMAAEVEGFCRDTHQAVPKTPGETVRCVLESLAASYRQKLDQVEELIDRRVETLHIVGGGSRNKLLNQLAADAVGRTVKAGPVECSAIGNIIVQAIALGDIASLSDARQIVRNSFSVETYTPTMKSSVMSAQRFPS